MAVKDLPKGVLCEIEVIAGLKKYWCRPAAIAFDETRNRHWSTAG